VQSTGVVRGVEESRRFRIRSSEAFGKGRKESDKGKQQKKPVKKE